MVILEKGRMEAHIYREHIPFARAPFRCTLCQFRCKDRQTLKDHTINYKPHVKAVKVAECPVTDGCLKESLNPYIVSEEDYHVYSQEESVKVWHEQRQKRSGPRESTAFLDGALAETINDADLQTVLPNTQQQGHTTDGAAQGQADPTDQTLQILSSLLNSGLLQLGPGFDVASLQAAVPNQEQGCEQTKVDKPDETAARASATPVQDETEIPPGWSPTTAFKASLPPK